MEKRSHIIVGRPPRRRYQEVIQLKILCNLFIPAKQNNTIIWNILVYAGAKLFRNGSSLIKLS